MKTTTVKVLFLFLFSAANLCGQVQTDILTSDIDNFWAAYDLLPTAETPEDSIRIFQTAYIDKASPGFVEFLKVRDFTAEEYTVLVGKYPKYWQSVRPNTLRVKTIRPQLEKIVEQYSAAFPGRETPKVCFAIGCLRTGGTVSNNYLLIGTEIAATDSTTYTAELNNWLKSVFNKEFDVTGMVAHEYVHALQKVNLGSVLSYLNNRVLTTCLMEGAADFLAVKVTGNTINQNIYAYGNAHEAEVWADFKEDMYGKNVDNWLYQGDNTEEGVPADLGYFVGYKICESYYNRAEDKAQALRDILAIKNAKRFFKRSGYGE